VWRYHKARNDDGTLAIAPLQSRSEAEIRRNARDLVAKTATRFRNELSRTSSSVASRRTERASSMNPQQLGKVRAAARV
jgi:hypothetical protein